MTKLYINDAPKVNLYKKMSLKSEVTSQIIYGQSFYVIKRINKWYKIKIKEDHYTGFIKKRHLINYFKPTHKVCALSANIYIGPSYKKKIGQLPFLSRLRIEKRNLKFSKFQGKWIENKNLKLINFKNKNIFSNIKIFDGIKYKWGGKTFQGLDCSALVQLFINFNNKYCPRDAKNQIKYFKKNIKLAGIKKNNIIYWKGHVAVTLNSKKLIHAYGPMKKTLIMGINQTIRKIKKTANLKVIGIKKL